MEVKLKSCGDQRSGLSWKTIPPAPFCVLCERVGYGWRVVTNMSTILFAPSSIIKYVEKNYMLPPIPFLACEAFVALNQGCVDLPVMTNKHLTKVLYPGKQIWPLFIHIACNK